MKTTLIFFLILIAVAAFAQRAGTPGVFDYYLLTLSWSPEYCSSHGMDPQCNGPRHFGFVVHGMWPQFNTGRWPEDCGSGPGLANPESMLDIMPSKSLIKHEWEKHGTCSGLDAKGFFALTREAYEKIKIPQRFVNPKDYQTMSLADLKDAFRGANPGLTNDGFSVSCNGGQLTEVRICLNKQLRPFPCEARDRCNRGKIVMPPVR